MSQASGERYSVLGPVQAATRIAKQPGSLPARVAAADACIVTTVGGGQGVIAILSVERSPLLGLIVSSAQLAAIHRGCPCRMVRLQQERLIRLLRSEHKELVAKASCSLEVHPRFIEEPETKSRRVESTAVADPCGQIARPGVPRCDLIDGAARCLNHYAKRHLQRDLKPASLLLVFDLLEEFESAGEICGRLGVGRPPRRHLA
jgi:hypothetical protein